MTQTTIKEKMEKILTDEIFNPEPCDIRLFATNIARLICEEMMEEGEVDAYNAKPGQCARCYEYDDCSCGGYYQRIEEEKLKAEEILKALE